MNLNLIYKIFAIAIILVMSNSCFTSSERRISSMDTKQLIAEVKTVSDAITKSAGEADLNSLLKCYSDSPDFLAISSDGKCRDFDNFRKICTEYYLLLRAQAITTTMETYHVISSSNVMLTWTGNITAYFKNGDTMRMNNYTVSSMFKKIANDWKVIHSQESALPPELSK